MSDSELQQCLKSLLEHEGYEFESIKEDGVNHADLLASGKDGTFHIEIIVHDGTGLMRPKDFYHVFFRAISHIKDGAEHCVIVLPHVQGLLFLQFVQSYGDVWSRMGSAFPELEI